MSPGDGSFQRDVLRVRESAKHICQYCNSGSNNRAEVFGHGACLNCGAGAKEIDIEYTERSFPKLKRQIFLVNANDIAPEAAQIKRGIEKKGLEVITLEDILPNGVSRNDIPIILERVTQEVPFVFFMPSPELDQADNDDVIINTLSVMHFRRHRGKAAAILTDLSKSELLPISLAAYPGICMTGDSDIGGMFFGMDTL